MVNRIWPLLWNQDSLESSFLAWNAVSGQRKQKKKGKGAGMLDQETLPNPV